MSEPNVANIRALLEELVRPILKLEPSAPLPWDQDLESLGIDSLTAVDLVDEVATHTGISMPATALLELKTLGDVAAFLEKEAVDPSPRLII